MARSAFNYSLFGWLLSHLIGGGRSLVIELGRVSCAIPAFLTIIKSRRRLLCFAYLISVKGNAVLSIPPYFRLVMKNKSTRVPSILPYSSFYLSYYHCRKSQWLCLKRVLVSDLTRRKCRLQNRKDFSNRRFGRTRRAHTLLSQAALPHGALGHSPPVAFC